MSVSPQSSSDSRARYIVPEAARLAFVRFLLSRHWAFAGAKAMPTGGEAA
jgi:hypothetical protein